jgi:hypothetical protein
MFSSLRAFARAWLSVDPPGGSRVGSLDSRAAVEGSAVARSRGGSGCRARRSSGLSLREGRARD